MADVNNKIRLIILFLLFLFEPVIMNEMHPCELCRPKKIVECVCSPDTTAVCNCLLMRNTWRYGFRPLKCYTKKAKPGNTGVGVVKTTEQQVGSNRNLPPMERYRKQQQSTRSNSNNANVAGSACVDKNNNQVNVAGSASVGSNRNEVNHRSNRPQDNGNTGVGVVKTTEQQVGSNRNLPPMQISYRKPKQPTRSNSNNANVAGSASVDKNNNQVNVAGSASVGSNRNEVNHRSNRPQDNGNTGVGVVKTTEQQVGSNRNLPPMQISYRKPKQPTRSNSNNANVAGSASVDKNNNQVNVAGSASVGSNRNEVNHGSNRPQDNGRKTIDEVRLNDRIEDNLPQDKRISKPYETQPVVTINQPTDSFGVQNNNNGGNTKLQQIKQRYNKLLQSMNNGTLTPWPRYNDNSFLAVVTMLFFVHVMFKVCS